jgi:hypothetical protein
LQTYKEGKLKGKKISDCLTAPSIKSLIRNNSEEEVLMTIEAILFASMQNFNVKYHLTDAQIEFFSEAFIEEFGHESIDDLIVCMKTAAKGSFGEIYNAIDPPTLFKWFRLHLDTKYQEKEKQWNRKKISSMNQCDDSPINQKLNQEFCKKIRQELNEKQLKKRRK